MDTDPKIDWPLLTDTIKYFEDRQAGGFRHIEVPWLVSEKAIRSTFSGHQNEAYPGLYTVGSAEQSFVELLLQGKLDPRKSYSALTPCFRFEPIQNDLTRPYFMKVELFKPYEEGKDNAAYFLAREACRNFHHLVEKATWTLRQRVKLDIVETSEGWDVEMNGIELGSYGVRHYEGFSWVYGTGLAEPRFSAALARLREVYKGYI